MSPARAGDASTTQSTILAIWRITTKVLVRGSGLALRPGDGQGKSAPTSALCSIFSRGAGRRAKIMQVGKDSDAHRARLRLERRRAQSPQRPSSRARRAEG